MKLVNRKFIVLFGIFFGVSSLLLTPIFTNAMDNSLSAELTLNDRVYRSMYNLEGSIDGASEIDEYLVHMKEGINYAFSVEFDADCTGLYSIQINRPGETYGFAGDHSVWTSTDVNKTLTLRITPDVSGDFTFIVQSGSSSSSATYVMNFSRTDFLRYWWIFVIAGGVLLVIIIAVVVISVKRKKGKKSKKKR